jgi:hypothetical protein
VSAHNRKAGAHISTDKKRAETGRDSCISVVDEGILEYSEDKEPTQRDVTDEANC